MGEPSTAEHEQKSRRKPPRSLARIAGEVLAGTATAAALAFLSVLMVGYGAGLAGVGEGCMDGLAVLAMMVYVVPPVYIFGCAIGVYLVGRVGNQTGSFLATLGGVFLGLPVMAVLYIYGKAAEDMMLGVEKIVLWPLVFLASPLMATLGFNLTRRYKESSSP